MNSPARVGRRAYILLSDGRVIDVDVSTMETPATKPLPANVQWVVISQEWERPAPEPLFDNDDVADVLRSLDWRPVVPRKARPRPVPYPAHVGRRPRS